MQQQQENKHREENADERHQVSIIRWQSLSDCLRAGRAERDGSRGSWAYPLSRCKRFLARATWRSRGPRAVDWAIKLRGYRGSRGRRSSERNKHVGMGWAEGERAFRLWRCA